MSQTNTIVRLIGMTPVTCKFCRSLSQSHSKHFSSLSNPLKTVTRASPLNRQISRNCSQALVADDVSKADLDQVTAKSCSTEDEATPATRFLEEVKTRTQLKGKLEKIKVKHIGHDKNMTIEVNRNYSTPLDVARHLGRNYVTLSACAVVNGKKVMDMNGPIW